MHQIYFLARIYPFWAVPLLMVCWHLGKHFRRRRSRLQYSFLALILILGVSVISWFVFRGDMYSDSWIRAAFTDQ